MSILKEIDCNLLDLEIFANNLALNANIDDIYLLNGDLGVGKTTFARFFINSLHDLYKIDRPENIKSPSYPIMINYPLKGYEIYHYDLYRLKNVNELVEIDIIENFKKNISIIEWPGLILNNYKLKNYYLINLNIVDTDKRKIKFQHFKNK